MAGDFKGFKTRWNEAQGFDEAIGFAIDVGWDGEAAKVVDVGCGLLEGKVDGVEEEAVFTADEFALVIDDELFPEVIDVVGDVGEVVVYDGLPGVELVKGIEEAEKVGFFTGLEFHAGQDVKGCAAGGLDNCAGIGAGVVVCDGQEVYAELESLFHD